MFSKFLKRSSRRTPPLDTPEKKANYLENHLNDSLRYLLTGGAEWYIQESVGLSLTGYEIQVFAMDSVILRARTLFEFFTEKSTENHYGFDEFNIRRVKSKLYTDSWKNPLHGFSLHSQDRSTTKQLKTKDRNFKDLNKMSIDFVEEAIRLWIEFAEKLSDSKLKDAAYRSLESALEAGQNTLNSVKLRYKKENIKEVEVDSIITLYSIPVSLSDFITFPVTPQKEPHTVTAG